MKRLHYAWIVVLVTFLSLLAAQAVRAAPGVIITSLESEFGWTRTAISFAVSLSILTFGLGGPLGGTLIDRFGPRRVMLVGEVLIAAGLTRCSSCAISGRCSSSGGCRSASAPAPSVACSAPRSRTGGSGPIEA